ncbi:hypothetical protein H5397_12720 [Propioniciclava sp. MC1683]|uniref:hypothetical protein n=1 Tax=Propioniciclava sp. MC1683 TaxID=2760309 RepID=UPI0016047A18|nr:hypothetical protein [Propioniciclava sp. MC1683]MBB1502276.1 hypothetical protein [Propioniciclava sp. MC1683]
MTDLPTILDALEAEKNARTDYAETMNGYHLTVGYNAGEVLLTNLDPEHTGPVSLDDPTSILLNVAQAQALARELDRVADLASTCPPLRTPHPFTLIHGGAR